MNDSQRKHLKTFGLKMLVVGIAALLAWLIAWDDPRRIILALAILGAGALILALDGFRSYRKE